MESNNVMVLGYLQTPYKEWTKKMSKSKEHPRHWITTVDIEVQMSDGYVIRRPKGTIWDGASIPKWLWWLFKPFDKGGMGDWIHDELWKDKEGQFKHFGYNTYISRKFADEERLRWRNSLAPKKKIKNYVTHWVIRIVGGLFYSKQLEIPN